MAGTQKSLTFKLNAINNMSGPFKEVSKAAGPVVESLKQTQERLKKLDEQANKFTAFGQLRKQSQSTSQALDKAQADVAELARQMKTAHEPVQALKRDFAAAERRVESLAREMEAAKEPNDVLKYRFQQSQKEAKELGKAFQKAERDNKALSRQFEQAKKTASRLKDTHEQEIQKLQKMRQALNQAGVSTKNLGSAQATAKNEAKSLTQEYERQAAKLEKIAAIEKSRSHAKARLGKSMALSAHMTVAGYGAGQAGQMVKQTLSGPVNVSMDFEERMSGVAAVANATDDQLKTLTETARKLGATTSFSATESAYGMKYLAMAGFKTKETISAMPDVLNLAKAGATDLATTSDIASDIMSGFKMSPEQMGRVSDVLTATFTTANTNLTMLGETMKYVGPVASKAGMSLEEAASMAGLLGNVGIKSSQAGTTLRAMVTRLSAPTGAAAKTLERLGVSTKNASGDMRNMVEIIGDIASATENMGNAEQLQVLKNVFGEEPAAGMAELLSQEGTEGITKYLEVVNNSNGLAAKVSAKMADNAKGRLKELSSAVESLQITLGNTLLPVVKKVAEWLTTVVRRFERWANEHQNLARVVMIAAAAIGGLAAAGMPLLLMMSGLNSVMALTRYSLTAFSAAGKLAAVRMGLMSAAQWALNAAVLANPITWIIVAIMALIAVIGVLIYKYFQPLKALVSGLWDGFVAGLSPVIESFKPFLAILSPVWTFLKWIWTSVSGLISSFSSFIEPVQSTAEELDNLRSTGQRVGEFIGKMFGFILSPITMATEAIGWFSDAWNSLFGDDEESEKSAKVKKITEEQAKVQAELASVNKTDPVKDALPKQQADAVAKAAAVSPASVPVSEQYQETVAEYVSPSSSASIPNSTPAMPSDFVPAQTAGMSVQISRLNIEVNPGPGMNAQEIAQEVRREFEKLMREQETRQRGRLYDA